MPRGYMLPAIPVLSWYRTKGGDTVNTFCSGMSSTAEWSIRAGLLQRLWSFLIRFRPVDARARTLCEVPTALAIMRPGPCRMELESIIVESGWKLSTSDTTEAAFRNETASRMPIIFCERELPNGEAILATWRDALSQLSNLSPRPYVILLSPTSDNNLRDELARYGGSAILRVPLSRDSVVRVVHAGWALWLSQQQVRHPGTRNL